MAFINSILTDEEKEMFKERAISYPSEIWWKRDAILGYEPYDKLWISLDREAKIYLFNCGRHPNSDEPDDFHFSLIWDDIFGNSKASFDLKRRLIIEPKTELDYHILWKLKKVYIPSGVKIDTNLLYEKFKKAMTAYGMDGDPELTGYYKVEFDF